MTQGLMEVTFGLPRKEVAPADPEANPHEADPEAEAEIEAEIVAEIVAEKKPKKMPGVDHEVLPRKVPVPVDPEAQAPPSDVREVTVPNKEVLVPGEIHLGAHPETDLIEGRPDNNIGRWPLRYMSHCTNSIMRRHLCHHDEISAF